jgi:hypothetical protein
MTDTGEPGSRRDALRRLDSDGWSLFLTWSGIAYLADVGWGVGLLGTGLVMLGVQAVRVRLGLRPEPWGMPCCAAGSRRPARKRRYALACSSERTGRTVCFIMEP